MRPSDGSPNMGSPHLPLPIAYQSYDASAMTIFVTGASGLLGGWLVATLREQKIDFVAPTHGELDITDRDGVLAFVKHTKPTATIHAAAIAVVACASDPERARRINVEGSVNVADACREVNARMVHISTDHVFDGEAAPYDESAPPNPLNVYGRTKAAAEDEVLRRASSTTRVVVVRTTVLYGPTRTKRRSFFDDQIDLFRAPTSSSSSSPSPQRIGLFDDEWRTPLSLRAAAAAFVAIAMTPREVSAVLHVGGPLRMSRYEMGVILARFNGVDPSAVISRTSRTSVVGEPRQRDLSLNSSRFQREFGDVASQNDFATECSLMMTTTTQNIAR